MRILITLATLWFATAPSIAQDTPADWSGWWGGLSLGLAGARPDGMEEDRFCFTTTEGDATASCWLGEGDAVELTTYAFIRESYFAIFYYSQNNESHEHAELHFADSIPKLPSATVNSISSRGVIVSSSMSEDSTTSSGAAFYVQSPTDLHLPKTANGSSFGFHVRHDWQSHNSVFGIEFEAGIMDSLAVDLGAISAEDFNRELIISETLELANGASLALKGRWGHAHGQVLPYVTGGIGVLHAQGSLSKTLDVLHKPHMEEPDMHASSRETTSKLLVGPVVGAGIAWQPADGVALSAEALYYAVSDRFDFSDGQHAELRDVFTAKLGLSLRLN